jgi:uncharacterized SAM-binding protein YcdF (DUF218 family)
MDERGAVGDRDREMLRSHANRSYILMMLEGFSTDSTPRGRVPGVLVFLRIVSFAAAGAAAVFLGGFGIFASYMSELATPDDVAPADAIIVLTGGQARLDAALDLLKSGKGERLLISGVHPAASRESLRAATGGDRDLFSCCVDIDRTARDTVGNAEESAKWVQSHDYARVILVTNNYHMPRSLLEMSRLVQSAKLEPYPVVNSRLSGGGWLKKPAALRVIFTEYTKYVAALVRGAVPGGAGPQEQVPQHTVAIETSVAAMP